MDFGMAAPFDGTMVPFLVSGGLGVVTVSMVLFLVKEAKPSQSDAARP
jgi:hypothetical protein